MTDNGGGNAFLGFVLGALAMVLVVVGLMMSSGRDPGGMAASVSRVHFALQQAAPMEPAADPVT